MEKTIKYRQPDPIIAEVPAIRDELTAKFGNDLEAILNDIRRTRQLCTITRTQWYITPLESCLNSTCA